MDTREQITQILTRLKEGESQASAELLPLLYEELRLLAQQRMVREPAGHTLQATALVHEAYLRLVGEDQNGPRWDSRGHFFAAAAEAMRRVLIDRARRVGRIKRGGDLKRESLGDQALDTCDGQLDLLALDDALQQLQTLDARKAEVVKLRYFAGLTLEQVAEALHVSLATVKNDWTFARAWLHRELAGEE